MMECRLAGIKKDVIGLVKKVGKGKSWTQLGNEPYSLEFYAPFSSTDINLIWRLETLS